jgi:hypothetical protein
MAVAGCFSALQSISDAAVGYFFVANDILSVQTLMPSPHLHFFLLGVVLHHHAPPITAPPRMHKSRAPGVQGRIHRLSMR